MNIIRNTYRNLKGHIEKRFLLHENVKGVRFNISSIVYRILSGDVLQTLYEYVSGRSLNQKGINVFKGKDYSISSEFIANLAIGFVFIKDKDKYLKDCKSNILISLSRHGNFGNMGQYNINYFLSSSLISENEIKEALMEYFRFKGFELYDKILNGVSPGIIYGLNNIELISKSEYHPRQMSEIERKIFVHCIKNLIYSEEDLRLISNKSFNNGEIIEDYLRVYGRGNLIDNYYSQLMRQVILYNNSNLGR